MALSDLKAKLAAIAVAVKTSVATVATERIEKAKARAAERVAKAEKAKEQKYLLDALPGTKEEKARRLEEIEQAMAEFQEIFNLLNEAEIELLRANKAAPADRDKLVATAQAVVGEVRAEKERIETDPDIKFFGWLKRIESQTENPDRRVAVEEIDRAIKDGLVCEIAGERAREIQAAVKAVKEDNQQQWSEERHAPFFWVRVKPRGNMPQGEQEPDDHFRYISGGADFYGRTTDGARKRLVFFALQGLWKAVGEAKKAAYEAAKDVKEHSYLTLADIAAGKTGQAWAEVTAANPWRPMFFNRASQVLEPLMKDGKEVVNSGPVVVESPRPGVLRVLNVSSGMFHPLHLAGAWDEEGKPMEFKFFAGNNSRGEPYNFAGLKPVNDVMDLSPAKLGRLRAILCLAGGLQAPAREEKSNGGASAPPADASSPATRRGYRSDGSKGNEPRRDKGGKKPKGRKGGDDVPEVPRNVRSLADAEE
ncbi:MAG: hypothetical protein Q7K16_01000 [Candidatus Azambacteria bacterium]|nr:hypothetical protein [Candidatus Azambacteria bacterium]